MDDTLIAAMLASTLRVSTPLILCALAGMFSERSGVVDIGLEGKMLFAAFAAGAAGAAYQSTALALGLGVLVAVALSWMHGLACVSHKGDQVVSGVAINIIAAGMTVVLGIAWFSQGGQTPPVGSDVRIQALFPGLPEALYGIPLVGRIVGEGLLSHNAMVYLALALVPACWWVLFRTRFGLRLRAVGENPQMVDAAGVSVSRLRYAALTINGVLCGLAGAYLVLAQSANFSANMTAGRGFMALAALIFGRWHPVGAFWACLLFGFLDAAAIRLQGVQISGFGEVPVQFIQALPYVLTVVLLAGFIGKAVAPQALGRPYSKER
ncbi:ABC transporter permease [Rhodoferax sp. TBRC 17660]|uniref:ABC transporter permease n=1 Tax=Rhodoferax potami TaxID=3068338 RepID=A0ABU3KRT0_9BURK|nr:ABC transporter permease [Rhodoferax sp. TBRC 17660]MDT7520524.1 ABC transporter permease [Rhodoferax sp. TBRC 17660]